MTKAFEQIQTLQKQESDLELFDSAVGAWLKSEKVDPDLKVRIVLLGQGLFDPQGNHLYERFRSWVPESQVEKIDKKTDQMTSSGLFQDIGDVF